MQLLRFMLFFDATFAALPCPVQATSRTLTHGWRCSAISTHCCLRRALWCDSRWTEVGEHRAEDTRGPGTHFSPLLFHIGL